MSKDKPKRTWWSNLDGFLRKEQDTETSKESSSKKFNHVIKDFTQAMEGLEEVLEQRKAD